MASLKKDTAYYHLPGLFEFYELYRVFLPLFYEHREYFYDWCDIGSIYGAPADCLWGGGRVGFGDHDPAEVLALLREYGISARLTFSNSLLREEHLSDRKCNDLCALFEEGGDQRNGVIVHSDLLLAYLKQQYPGFYFVSSTTKVLTDFEDLCGEINREDFSAAVDAIVKARRIYILGVRSSNTLSSFLSFYFNLIFEDVRHVQTTLASEMFEQLLRVREGDVVIGISFPRYSKRTLSAMKYARDRGARVIALTDSQLSPLARVADHVLLARSDMASFVDSLVAPLSVINALIVAVGMSRRDEIEHTFNKLERIWEEYDV